MMQMPLSSYPPFSQFLQLQQLHQQHFSQSYPTLSPDLSTMLLSSRRSGATSCSEASTETPSTSPSPPPSITDNFQPSGTPGSQQNSTKSVKSFTIDAILGIRDREIDKINGDHLNVAISNSYRPKLGLDLTGSHNFENYSNSLNLSNSGLDIRTRIDVARYSNSAKDFLGFQLPTDFSSSADASGSEINKRNLHNKISYPNSGPCGSSTEKSLGEISKKCGGKSKRVRTIFTPEQLERLEAEFERQQYMVGPERLYLAHTLQLTEAQVKVWFQNRRIKWRKQHLEIQQQRLAAIKQQNQKNEMEESDNEDSGDGDGNNFGYSADNYSRGNYYKSDDQNTEVALASFQRISSGSPPHFQNGEKNVSENTNENDPNGENSKSK